MDKACKRQLPPVRLLQYKKGDLIIKEDDYGVSIYKIVKGRVQVFTESGGREVVLATLGPGEIIGEMTFLKGIIEPRTASVRALERCELEVWHFQRIRKEYALMPSVIKAMVDQSLDRLVKMNRILVRMDIRRQQKESTGTKEPKTNQRHHYRKAVDLTCLYRPAQASEKAVFKGRIKNLSLNGLGLEIARLNTLKCPHEPGRIFTVSTMLPTGHELDMTARIVSVSNEEPPGKAWVGMSFVEMTEELRKRLGFFLLP